MKTVIEMAREAGIEWDLIDKDEGQVWYITQAGLERFAELVRADERKKWEGQTAAELRRLHEANQAMLSALNEINSWLVCACIAAPEDMAQSFPHMQKVADAAIAKGEQQ